MHSSMTITSPLFPSFHQPNTYHPSYKPPPMITHQNPTKPNNNICTKSLKNSGFLSAIGNAIEEQEYRKARAEVIRKGTGLEGYNIEGLSVGGNETCVIVPEFKSAFDIGRCPPRAVAMNFLFITHAHLDHIGGLPMYVATRGLYNMSPPTVFVPPSIKDDVENLMELHRKMGDVELNLDLVALDVGETYELRNDLVVRPFKTYHVIPSQITDTILSPEVAFTGDTSSDFLLDPRSSDALRAKVLITEATFLDDQCNIEHAREHGHMHIDEIIEHSKWIRNKAILLTHFSARYHIEEIRQAVTKLQAKVQAKVVPLTEGFRSMYTP
ncbi:hypothetical protein M8C21_017785 [Ambrosia artemisiifolia]|uniref:Metallo-beta-lactamase domain-containing protein n=1 Tax=Ambrosia artemisiifolia TaxID=4212 RepID=A0AAD5C485_AMBAR|nr:hypothetical protein M8C21_017785 [Ambrosia artemisiifolia]